MVNGWFGTRWFGFLGSPEMKGLGFLGVPHFESQTTKPNHWLNFGSKKKTHPKLLWEFKCTTPTMPPPNSLLAFVRNPLIRPHFLGRGGIGRVGPFRFALEILQSGSLHVKSWGRFG